MPKFFLFELKKTLSLVLFVVLLISVGIFYDFIFGNNLYLFSDIGSDTLYSYYPIYYMLIGYLQDGGIPFWTFRVGAGVSMLSFYQHIYDPFLGILYAFGLNEFPNSLVLMYILKIVFSAFFSYLYLCRVVGNKLSAVLGAICFSFSGFLMGFGQHSFYASWIIFLPLVLYSIELTLEGGKSRVLILCVAFLMLNIAILWQMAIFCTFYVIFRIIIDSKVRLRPVRFSRVYLIIIATSVLGIGLSAAFWLPEYLILRSSSRVSSDTTGRVLDSLSGFLRLHPPAYYWSLISRIFSNNLEGVGSNYVGYLNYYESLQLYCGLLWLLVIPQYWVAFSRKGRAVTTIAIVLTAFFLFTQGFATVMNGFQYPSFRWGYGIAFFEIILGVLVLNELMQKRKIDLTLLLGTFVFLAFLLYVLSIHTRSSLNSLEPWNIESFLRIVLYLFLYSIILVILVKSGGKPIWIVVLIGLLSVELIQEHRPSFLQRSAVPKGIENNANIPYFDGSLSLVKSLKKSSREFYRIEKEHWILSLNDSMIQNYNSLDSYNSLNHPSFVEFFEKFSKTRHQNVLQWRGRGHEELADVLSVKYLLSKGNYFDVPELVPIKSNDGVQLYERTGFLPFGFTYDEYMLKNDWMRLPLEDQERALLHVAIVESPWSSSVERRESLLGVVSDSEARLARRSDVLDIDESAEDRFTGKVSLDREKLIFFSIPFDPGWSATVNGRPQLLKKMNVGFSGLLLSEGENQIELSYTPLGMRWGITISLASWSIFVLLLLWERIGLIIPRKIQMSQK